MFRLFVIPVIIGILVFLSIYFLSPVFISESHFVSHVAEFVLNLSNRYFDTMPSIMARYVAGLNLLIVALTGGLLAVVATQFLVIIVGLSRIIAKGVISFMQKEKEVDEVTDLPPIELDQQFDQFDKGKKVQGKGFDSIERD